MSKLLVFIISVFILSFLPVGLSACPDDCIYYIDSYTTGGDATDVINGGGQYTGQAFTMGSGARNICCASFYLQAWNVAPDYLDVQARIYACSGTVGTSGIKTGVALATSETIRYSGYTAYSWQHFNFTTPYTLSASTDYCIVLYCTTRTDPMQIALYYDGSSPTHSGNYFDQTGYSSTKDLLFMMNYSDITPDPPTGFTNLGIHLTDHTPTVSWTDDVSTDTTYVYVGTTSTPTTVEGSTASETLNLGSTVTLSDGITYYYRLRSYNTTFSTWSDYTTADQFRMNSKPPVPTLSSPSSASVTTTTPTVLTTNSVSDDEGDTVQYLFYADTSANPTTLRQTSTSLTYSYGHPSTYDNYYWKVRSHDGYEYSTSYSSIWYFAFIDLDPPTGFTNLGDHLTDHTPTITWTDDVESDTTYVYVGTTSTPTDEEGHTASETMDLGNTITLSDGITYYYRLRSYNSTLSVWSDYTTADEFRMNTKPPVPTLSSPSGGYATETSPTVLTTNSVSDDEGDTVYYYIYADTNANPTTLRQSTTSLTYSYAHPETYGPYYWKVRTWDGYEYSTSYSSIWDFKYLEIPLLYTPINESTHDFTYPPNLHDITFTWENLTASIFHLEISTDENFIGIYKSVYPTVNYTTVEMEADRYWWRVAIYDEVSGEYSDTNETFNFNVTDTKPDLGTAVIGIIYELTSDGSEVPLEGALVAIWNNTYSDEVYTGSNGYYSFEGLCNTTYNIQATKSLYDNSMVYIATLTTDVTSTVNIFMQITLGDYDWRHYVKFNVKDQYGNAIPDTTVAIHENEAVIATQTGTTGTDGTITFDMYKNIRYKIVFTNDDPTLSRTIYLYPIEVEYIIEVNLDTTKTIHNVTTTGPLKTRDYINFSWSDPLNELTWVKIVITNSDGVVFSETNYTQYGSINYTITNISDIHCVEITLDYDDFDTVTWTECYTPKGYPIDDLGLSDNSRNMISMFFLFILAGTFTRKSAPVGALVLVMGASALVMVGYLSVGPAIITIMFVIAFGALIKPKMVGER